MMTPKRLTLWTRTPGYMGANWAGYYSAGVGQSRESDALARSNFRAMYRALQRAGSMAEVVSEPHWAVGWVEWIAIPGDDAAGLAEADRIMARLEKYPVIDAAEFEREQNDDAQRTWAVCYSEPERLAYIRAHRSQFEFRDLADVRGCVRGEYFTGYASELLTP